MDSKLPDAEIEGYGYLTAHAGIVNLGRRTWLTLTGKDRAAFLNNFCTANLKSLEPGNACEAFILNVKGKIVAHVHLALLEDRLEIVTAPGFATRIGEHLDKYIIREDVQIADRSAVSACYFVAGPSSAENLRRCLSIGPGHDLQSGNIAIAGPPLLVGVDWTVGGGWLICNDRELDEETFAAAEIRPAPLFSLEMARIEHGFPLMGTDITSDNLPQEVNRDKQCISFTKGCYLGQETVARIDALGHVNRLLVGIRITEEGRMLTPEIFHESRKIGRVTSYGYSPTLGAQLALGYVRRGHETTGSRVMVGDRAGIVVDIPVAS